MEGPVQIAGRLHSRQVAGGVEGVFRRSEKERPVIFMIRENKSGTCREDV